MITEYNYLSASTVQRIVDEFKYTIPKMFAGNLCFAFIFGGFGKGYATDKHDIDMFIVVHHSPNKQEHESFLSWYFDIHRRFALPADDKYPGEIVNLSLLREKMRFLSSREFRLVIPSYYEYEAILWGDALAERKIGFVGDQVSEYLELHSMSSQLFRRWRESVYSDFLSQENRIELEKLDLRRLFKKAGIRYSCKTPS